MNLKMFSLWLLAAIFGGILAFVLKLNEGASMAVGMLFGLIGMLAGAFLK